MDQMLMALLGGGGGDMGSMGLTSDAIAQALKKDEEQKRAQWMMNFGAALASPRGGGNLLSGLGQAALTANSQATRDDGAATKKLFATAQLQGMAGKQQNQARQVQNRLTALKSRYPNVPEEQLQAAAADENWREILNPKMESIFDEATGNEVKGYRNPFDGSFVREGGAKKASDGGFTLPAGGVRYDANGKVIARAPVAPQSGVFDGNSMDAQAWNIVLNPQSDPNSSEYAAAYSVLTQPKLQMTENGLVPVTPTLPPTIRRPGAGSTPPVADVQTAAPPAATTTAAAPEAPFNAGAAIPGTKPAKEFTSDQRLAAGFANRIQMANDVIQRMGGAAADPMQRTLGSVPGVGNYLVSDEFQRVDQAMREFINAQLRRESGAAISPTEFASAAKQYFPQPGDDEPTLEQKRQSRELAFANMKMAAGSAYAPAQAGPRREAASPTGTSPADNPYANMTDDQIVQQLRAKGLLK